MSFCGSIVSIMIELRLHLSSYVYLYPCPEDCQPIEHPSAVFYTNRATSESAQRPPKPPFHQCMKATSRRTVMAKTHFQPHPGRKPKKGWIGWLCPESSTANLLGVDGPEMRISPVGPFSPAGKYAVAVFFADRMPLAECGERSTSRGTTPEAQEAESRQPRKSGNLANKPHYTSRRLSACPSPIVRGTVKLAFCWVDGMSRKR